MNTLEAQRPSAGARTLVDALRARLGAAFRVSARPEGRWGDHIEVGLADFAGQFVSHDVTHRNPSLDRMVDHLADRYRHRLRELVEEIGLPPRSGYVQVPVATWVNIRLSLLTHQDPAVSYLASAVQG